MITVQININGNCILARSAVNIGKADPDFIYGKNTPLCKYKVDDGSIIEHNQKDGAVALAHKLLDTIKEMKKDQI